MKPNYFGQSSADVDDHLLIKAKLAGHVPLRCLLGGEAVMSAVQARVRPCDTCDGPRERCHGTPKLDGVRYRAYGTHVVKPKG